VPAVVHLLPRNIAARRTVSVAWLASGQPLRPKLKQADASVRSQSPMLSSAARFWRLEKNLIPKLTTLKSAT
jgi:hypothetical protein